MIILCISDQFFKFFDKCEIVHYNLDTNTLIPYINNNDAGNRNKSYSASRDLLG